MQRVDTYSLQDLARSSIGNDPVGEAQRRVVVLAPHGQVHGVEKSQLAVGHLNLGNGKVSRQLQAALEELGVLGHHIVGAQLSPGKLDLHGHGIFAGRSDELLGLGNLALVRDGVDEDSVEDRLEDLETIFKLVALHAIVTALQIRGGQGLQVARNDGQNLAGIRLVHCPANIVDEGR